jgi:hypothetical protein
MRVVTRIEGVERRAIGGGAKFQTGDTLLARVTPCLESGKTVFVRFLSDEDPVANAIFDGLKLTANTLEH